MSLATKYRPKTFEEVAGQSLITEMLKKAVSTGKFGNALLFAGPSGTGKTTLARIFANEVNKGIGSPIEIDAASNSGVDSVRSIVESMNSRAIAGEYKIFVIDECHAISSAGWQAFLKGIEECPKYTILIFCTTEPNKIPQTIINRVQRYNLSKISAPDIRERLKYICSKEGFSNGDAACDMISKVCQGGMRDAISMLERCADFSTDLSLTNVKKVLGESDFETMFRLTWAIQGKKPDEIVRIVDGLYETGRDLKQFIGSYLDFALDLEKYLFYQDIDMTAIPAYLATENNAVVQFTMKGENSLDFMQKLAEALLSIRQLTKYDGNARSTIEVVLIKLSREAN
jgi:DNA polymerase III subunit gamma/tau